MLSEAPRAAVLGSPIAHSLSPVMHRAAYAHLRLGWQYERHECDAAGLGPFVAALGPHWRGLSLTMPLKEHALTLASCVDPLAARAGAANTLVRRAGGWWAYNTDVHGVGAALDRAGIGYAERLLVLGAGATTRSVMLACVGRGARQVTFAVREHPRPGTVALAETLGLEVCHVLLERVGPALGSADLVVNSLPGRAGAPVAAQVAAGRGSAGLPPLLEIVYEGWPTALARAFAAVGAPVASGLDMLAAQAAEQVRLMSGLDLPPQAWAEVTDVMLRAARERLAEHD